MLRPLIVTGLIAAQPVTAEMALPRIAIYTAFICSENAVPEFDIGGQFTSDANRAAACACYWNNLSDTHRQTARDFKENPNLEGRSEDINALYAALDHQACFPPTFSR